MSRLFLCTDIPRDKECVPVVIYYEARCTSRPYAATWDEPVGAPGEYEFTITDIEVDDTTGEILTDAELAAARAWFATAQDEAAANPDDHASDWDADLADWRRDQRISDQLMRD